VLRPVEALAEANRLLAAGEPFAAHEVLEQAWKVAPPVERGLWQGLAQLAVGFTHAQRGNAAGATSLLRRGRDRIEPYAERPPYGIAVDRLLAAADSLVHRIDSAGLDDLDEDDLRVRLTGP
jgi:predicted metal-dependent hydrolase